MRIAAIVALVGCLIITGCSKGDGESSDAPFTERKDAIVRIKIGEKSETLSQPKSGTAYVAHAVCHGAESMAYKILVNDQQRSTRTFECEHDVIQTAFVASGSENIRVEIVGEKPEGASGFVEIIPYDK